MNVEEKRAYGAQVFGEMMGEDLRAALVAQAESTGFGSQISRMALDYAFADVWGAEGLLRKERSLVVIGVLIATRQTQELRNHIRIGIRNGLTVAELEQVLCQCLPYLGFPAVASATTVVIEVLRELGLDPNQKTAEERGLL